MHSSKRFETILVLVLAMVIMYKVSKHDYWLTVAVVTGIICLLSSYIAGRIHWAWTRLSLALGYIASRILLTVIFFLILTPLSFLRRVFGKKTSMTEDDSYFKRVNRAYNKEDFRNMW